MKPALFFFKSLVILYGVFLLSSILGSPPPIFIFLHIKHEIAIEFHFESVVENACGMKQIFSLLMDK